VPKSRVRLACPVRAQEAEHLATGDTERHVGDGGPFAEILGQMTDLDGHRRHIVTVLSQLLLYLL
jgi:hypothetical protein